MILFPRQMVFRVLWAVWLVSCACITVVALSGCLPILWETTQANVIKTHFETRQGGHLAHSYWPRVEYEYSCGHTIFTNNCLQLGGVSFDRKSRAQKELEKFQQGETVEVRYLCFYPSIAAIYPGTSGPLWIVGLGGFLFYGLVIISLNANAINARTKRGALQPGG